MDTNTILLICGLAIVAAIVLSLVFKVNAGFFALCFSFLIAYIFMGLKTAQIYAMWPVKLFFTIVFITMFFGFAIQNGTVLWIADRLLGLSKGNGKILPFVLWLSGCIPCILGATGYTIIAFLAPIAFALGKKANMKLPLIITTCATGCMAGSNFIAGYGNNIIKSLVEASSFSAYATHASVTFFVFSFVANFLLFLVYYVIFGGLKLKRVEVNREKVKLTREQKGSFILIFTVMFLVLAPMIINQFANIAFVKTFANWFDVATICMFAAVLSYIFKLGDEKEILRHRVPWGTVFLATSFSLLMAIATKVGVTELISSWVSSTIPSVLIAPTMGLFGGFMTFFAGAVSVVCPILYPMVDGIVAATGLPANMLFMTIAVTACSTAISPLGTSGSLFLAQVDESIRDKTFYMQFGLAFCSMFFMIIIGFLGFFRLFPFA